MAVERNIWIEEKKYKMDAAWSLVHEKEIKA